MKNLVTLNIGEHGNGETPEPGKPVLTINGVAIDGLYGLKLEAAAGELTRVTVSFYAKVNGQFAFEDEQLVFADRQEFDRLMKEGR